MNVRYVPLFGNRAIRTVVGLIIALASPLAAARLFGTRSGGLADMVVMALIFWLPAVLLTDRYVHKYPQRYYSYLFASHLKGAGVMVFTGLVMWIFGFEVLWSAILIFVAADILLSVPRRRVGDLSVGVSSGVSQETTSSSNPEVKEVVSPEDVQIDTGAIVGKLPGTIPQPMVEAIKAHLPRCETGNDALLVLSDIDGPLGGDPSGEVGVLVGTLRLNSVNRLNYYLRFCAGRVTMGGYMVVSYLPLEDVLDRMRTRYSDWLYPWAYLRHFIRYRALPKMPWLDRLYFLPQLAWFDRLVRKAGGGRNRALSKSEVWGRLAFYGMEVLYESEGAGERCVIAQRVAQPVANRKPSYYAVVTLEKVGLDGKVIRLHKVRSMYPFSEFLQKKIFQSHGLSNTGKFKNDFRLTDYGPMIRRSWIDEIPGIFDWLHGEIKLVGMRATSPHFLGLYPRDVYDLYIQVKPGLVPPIFDEKTTGFDQIVEIERTYLTKYIQAPVRTDILYFWCTFRDIFIRKVRSS